MARVVRLNTGTLTSNIMDGLVISQIQILELLLQIVTFPPQLLKYSLQLRYLVLLGFYVVDSSVDLLLNIDSLIMVEQLLGLDILHDSQLVRESQTQILGVEHLSFTVCL
jgi:hypothetical protein